MLKHHCAQLSSLHTKHEVRGMYPLNLVVSLRTGRRRGVFSPLKLDSRPYARR